MAASAAEQVVVGTHTGADQYEIPVAVLEDPLLSRKAIALYAQLLRDRNAPEVDLAVRLGCTKKNLTKIFAQLIRQGHVEIVTVRGREARSTRILTGIDQAPVQKAS